MISADAQTVVHAPHFVPPSRTIADERGAARARAQLQSSAYLEIRQLDCTFAEGVLTVEGRLPSFYLKQVMWSLLGRLAEIHEVADRVEVEYRCALRRAVSDR